MRLIIRILIVFFVLIICKILNIEQGIINVEGK